MFGLLSLATNIFSPINTFACDLNAQAQRIQSEIASYQDLLVRPSVADSVKQKLEQIKNQNLEKHSKLLQPVVDKLKLKVKSILNNNSLKDFSVKLTSNNIGLTKITGTILVNAIYEYKGGEFGEESTNYRFIIDKNGIKIEEEFQLSPSNSPKIDFNARNTAKVKLDNYVATAHELVNDDLNVIRDRSDEFKDKIVVLQRDLKNNTCIIKTKAIGESWSGSNAAWYARNYYKDSNNNYPTYGLDCTNFMAQAIVHGGLKHDGGDIADANAWWIRRRNPNEDPWKEGGFISTDSWRLAAKLPIHMDKNEYTSNYISIDIKNSRHPIKGNIRLGDLVYFDYNKDNAVDHIMMVTGWDGAIPRLSGHTDSILNKSMKEYYGQNWNMAYMKIFTK